MGLIILYYPGRQMLHSVAARVAAGCGSCENLVAIAATQLGSRRPLQQSVTTYPEDFSNYMNFRRLQPDTTDFCAFLTYFLPFLPNFCYSSIPCAPEIHGFIIGALCHPTGLGSLKHTDVYTY
jgi:hypothetical protein